MTKLILAKCIIVSYNGVAFFEAQDDLLPTDLAQLGLLFGSLSGPTTNGSLHVHPTQELSERGLPIGSITNKVGEDGRQISFASEKSKLASAEWHSDVTFEPRPAAYTILRMVRSLLCPDQNRMMN
jgi:alpha-ketoglutarate-dependent taurine dioxygenase